MIRNLFNITVTQRMLDLFFHLRSDRISLDNCIA